jgi:hypothetical protein
MQTTRTSYWAALGVALAFAACSVMAAPTLLTTKNASMATPQPVDLTSNSCTAGAALTFSRSDAVCGVSGLLPASHISVDSTMTGVSTLGINLGNNYTWTGKHNFTFGTFGGTGPSVAASTTSANDAVSATSAVGAGNAVSAIATGSGKAVSADTQGSGEALYGQADPGSSVPVMRLVQQNTTRGHFNLFPLAADPSGPSDGDVWITGTSAKMRVNGSTLTVPSTATSTGTTPVGGGLGGTSTVTPSGAISTTANLSLLLQTSSTTYYTAGPDMRIWSPHTGPSAFGSCVTYNQGIAAPRHLSAWNGSALVIACPSANVGLFYTTDGLNWTVSNPSASIAWGGVAYGNGIWVVIPTNSTSYATSPDGFNWTIRTGFPVNWGSQGIDIFFDGAKFIATNAPANSAVVTPTVVYSTDGISWQTSASPPGANILNTTYSQLACNNTICAMLTGGDASGNGKATWSADHGATWTTTNISGLGAFSAIETNLTYTNGAFVILRGGIETRSTDGKVWANSAQAASQNGTFIMAVNGTFVAPVANNNGAVYVSSDSGVTWTNTGNTNFTVYPTQPLVAFMTGMSINATTLTGCTWGAPCLIGNVTPSSGAFTTLTGTTLAVGSGTTMNKYLEGSSGSLAFGTVTQDTTASQTFTLTGAVTSNSVAHCSPTAAMPTGTTLAYSYVSAANTVTVAVMNAAANQAVTATFNCVVMQ